MRYLLAALLLVPALANAQSVSLDLFAKAGFQVPKSRVDSLDFTLPTLDGKNVTLGSHKGSVVLLKFWATWCPPCRAEIPSLESLYSSLKPKGLVMLAVDLAEDKKKVQDFVGQNKMDVPVLLDATGDVGNSYGVQAIPATFVLDKSGRIVALMNQSWNWTAPETTGLIQKLLAE